MIGYEGITNIVGALSLIIIVAIVCEEYMRQEMKI